MKAAERLAKRLENERQRGERFKASQREQGKRQVLLWLSESTLEAIDRHKLEIDAANRAEVISFLVKDRQP